MGTKKSIYYKPLHLIPSIIEDEIPEELSAEADLCSGLEEIAVTLSPLVSKAACQDEEDAELMTAAAVYGYDDDFEDDSEAEVMESGKLGKYTFLKSPNQSFLLVANWVFRSRPMLILR